MDNHKKLVESDNFSIFSGHISIEYSYNSII